MRTSGAAIQGGLALIGLALAYTTWQREPEKSPGEAVVIDASKSDLQKLRYEDLTQTPPKWVEVTPATDGDAKSAWLKVSPQEKPQKAPERELRGNEAAVKLLEKFAPLRATRALGTLPADKLKELGLDAPKKKLEVTTAKGKRVFSIGSSPFNVSDPYVMDDADKRVYVLGGGVLQDLDAASVRLVDRALHTWKPAEADGVTLTVGDKKREFSQVPGDTPAAAKLVAVKSAKPDDMAKNWHDKLSRLFVVEVLGKGEKPEGGDPQPVMRLDYKQKGKALGFVEIGRVAAPPVAPGATASTAPPAPSYYARSERTAGWAKLPATADELAKEADKIIAGE